MSYVWSEQLQETQGIQVAKALFATWFITALVWQIALLF